MSVQIKLEYYGMYSQKAGKKIEELSVPVKIQEAYDFILEYLSSNYEINPPFILTYGKVHIAGALKEDVSLKDQDIFKLIPFISGG